MKSKKRWTIAELLVAEASIYVASGPSGWPSTPHHNLICWRSQCSSQRHTSITVTQSDTHTPPKIPLSLSRSKSVRPSACSPPLHASNFAYWHMQSTNTTTPHTSRKVIKTYHRCIKNVDGPFHTTNLVLFVGKVRMIVDINPRHSFWYQAWQARQPSWAFKGCGEIRIQVMMVLYSLAGRIMGRFESYFADIGLCVAHLTNWYLVYLVRNQSKSNMLRSKQNSVMKTWRMITIPLSEVYNLIVNHEIHRTAPWLPILVDHRYKMWSQWPRRSPRRSLKTLMPAANTYIPRLQALSRQNPPYLQGWHLQNTPGSV